MINYRNTICSIILTRTHSYSLLPSLRFEIIWQFLDVFRSIKAVLGPFNLKLTRTHSCQFLDFTSFLDYFKMYFGQFRLVLTRTHSYSLFQSLDLQSYLGIFWIFWMFLGQFKSIQNHTHSCSLVLTHTHSYSLILTHTHSYSLL